MTKKRTQNQIIRGNGAPGGSPLLRGTNRRTFMAATGGAGAALAFAGMPGLKAWAAGKDTLVVGTTGEAITLDPGVSFDGTSILLWRPVYESLVRYDGDSYDIVPFLAEDYTISPDKLTYTFKIRPGVTFSDGTTFDAHAAKFNIERQIGIQQGVAFALEPIESIETPDDMTLVIKIREFSDSFFSALAGMYSVMMISPTAIKEHEVDGDWAQAWLRDNMVGTGPYVLQNYTQAQQAVFAMRPDYWGGWDGDHVDRVFIKYFKEPTTERLLLENGEIDIAMYLPDDMVEEIAEKPGIKVTNVPSENLYYIVLPTHYGPTKDPKVRRAMAYAFDYETWIEDFMRGNAQQARGPLPSGMVGFDPTTPQLKRDLEKARELLSEAGYPDGGFSIDYIYESGYWWKRPLGELFQANMKDLGIEVNIQEMSPSAWVATLSNPDTARHAYGLVWWPTLATPFDFLYSVFATGGQGDAGFNWGYYSNPELDQLLQEASSEVDDQKRMELYSRAQHIVAEDAPAIFVYEKNYRLPMRDNVEGFVFNGVYIESLDFYALHKS